MMRQLIRYDAMVHAIAECHRIDEVKEMRDKAMALEMYAKQARNLDAERKAAEVRLRAERRAGELLSEQAANGARRTGHGDQRAESHAAIPNLSDLGISATQSSRWQALAEVPEKEFNDALRDPVKKPTTTGIINRLGMPQKLDADALWFWGRLREFEQRGYFDADVRVLLDEMTDAMRSDCCRLIPLALAFFQRAEESIDGR